MRTISKIYVLLFSMCLTTNVIAEIYRYKDNRGITVITRFGIPPEHVHLGYEILDDKGRVIKKVAPALNSKQIEANKNALLQLHDDRRLMQLYSSKSDVERQRDRRLREIDLSISNEESKLSQLMEHMKRIEKSINIEKESDRDISDLKIRKTKLLTNIKDMTIWIEEQKERRNNLITKFDADIKRMCAIDLCY